VARRWCARQRRARGQVASGSGMGTNGDYVGAIKSFNPHKGWGFIECAETHQIYGKDILFQQGELPAPVEKGDRVSFTITQGRNGLLAVGIQLLDSRDAGDYIGTIKSYNPQKGWGFVACDETQQLYGKDILVLADELPSGNAAQGQQVYFSVSQGRKGPLATNVRYVGDRRPQQRTATMLRESPTTPNSPSTFHGVLKSFNSGNGWGFVECKEAYDIYGKDILVLREDLEGLPRTPGTRVSFTITQGRNGPLAKGLRCSGGGMPASTMASPSPMRLAQSWPKPSSAPGLPWVQITRPMPTKLPGSVEHVCGRIKSFDERTGWGFVEGDAIHQLYGKDIFVSKTALQGQSVSPGDQVKLSVEMGMKGPMAVNVQVLPQGSFSAEGVPGTVYMGTIKSFNSEKGWGFVTSEETEQIFGKDLFLHKREVGEMEPVAGMEVQFFVQLSVGGRPEATGVTSLSDASTQLSTSEYRNSYAPVRGVGKRGNVIGAAPAKPY